MYLLKPVYIGTDYSLLSTRHHPHLLSRVAVITPTATENASFGHYIITNIVLTITIEASGRFITRK